MPSFPMRSALALLTLASFALPGPVAGQVAAQDDPAALELIEQLRPRTRGIRVPAPTPTPTPTPAEVPAPTSAVPQDPPASATPLPSLPVATPAPLPQPAPPAPPGTTAPAGVAAVSITVNFPSGSATLTRQAQDALAPLGRALSSAELAPFRFRIEGHTDSVGAEVLNQRLSARRAQAVQDFLVSRFGVSGQRLEAVGLGESRPLVDVGDGVDEPRNRRVQVINLDD
ncbi:OmpA family protein [Falsiroseomonas sp. HC035]|uniref:OmpA family protein n=1 Tax=Falsiroseomonas sp. HC035 TaxID=3390999 RepID=UPI003D31D9AC